jgi:hypothetical protein
MLPKIWNGLGKGLKELRSRALPELAVLIVPWLPIDLIPSMAPGRNRIFTPFRTLLLFFFQVLSGNLSCEEVVQKAVGWLEPVTGNRISSNTGAYSQARQRLSSQVFYDLSDEFGRKAPADPLFHGHTVKVADGTGILVADTEANRKAFPAHPKSGSYSGFPGFKLLAVFSLHLGTMIEWAVGAMRDSEHTPYRAIWPSLKNGDLVLGDRGFCGFAEFAWLQRRGVHCLARKNGRRKYHRVLKSLGPNDSLVQWEKPKQAPDWISPEDWERIPQTLTVREIVFNVELHGFRTSQVTIDTTLLDESITSVEFGELYRKRWKAELFLRDIKITMGMDMLKCKTPDMVEKELHIFILAYNLIRLIMFQAAAETGEFPTQVSFRATVSAIREWGPRFAAARSEREIEFLLEQFLRVVAYRRLRNRPDRNEPRALKRRQKTYQLLTGPRHEFKEIKHRSKYHKELN